MEPPETEPRERILQAAVQLLQEQGDASRVTVRRIAALAGVGVGLVNYHYRSKEDLLDAAFGRILAQQARPWLEARPEMAGPPLARLKQLARQIGETALDFPRLARPGIERAALNARFETALAVLPLLREHFGARKGELELRALALALVSALLVAFLRLDEAAAFVGLDPRDRARLAALSDLIIEQVLGEEERKLTWKT